MPAKTKVALKINFSNPRLVKDEEENPCDLPKPVPLAWTKIAQTRSSETII